MASNPDCRIFASYPMPAKIDLLNERPRRESLVEQQLKNKIGTISPNVPRIALNEQSTNNILNGSQAFTGRTVQQQQQQQQLDDNWNGVSANGSDNYQRQFVNELRSPTGRSELRETRIVINRHSNPITVDSTGPIYQSESQTIDEGNYGQHQQQQQQQQRQGVYSPGRQLQSNDPYNARSIQQTVTTTTTSTLMSELAEKEAKLMREIDALHQRPYSPSQSPGKIDLTDEQRVTTQQHYQSNASPRPLSSASSTGADLLDKEAKLLKEIEEIESKPFNPQTMIVEREKWYEYPEDRPENRYLTDSRRRVRDFCSMPTGLARDRFIHEENLPVKSQPSPTPGSIHTTIIRSPKREIDNKSPLPFAFDNFTTKGIRGNIATVGAVEPDRPRAPIFPIVKRTPSPAYTHN